MKGIDSLAALMEEADKAGQQNGSMDVVISHIRRDSNQPRRTFNTDTLKELAATITVQGVIQPIVIRPDPEREDHYVLISGERRWRASQIAGVSTIPAVVRDVDDHTALAMQLIENINREGVAILEEAEAVARLVTELGRSSEAAKSLGKTAAWVSQRRKIANGLFLVQSIVDGGATRDPETLCMLVDLAKIDGARYEAFLKQTQIARAEVREALDLAKGKTPVKIISKKPDSEQHPEFPAQDASKTASKGRGRESNKVSHVKLPRIQKSSEGRHESEDLSRLEKDLSRLLGHAVTIKIPKKGDGELRVKFASLDQLNEILKHIH